MSDRTAAALSTLDVLLPVLSALPAGTERDTLIDEAQALRRAVAAFHMEAIRFRMYAVDRLIRQIDNPAQPRELFEQLRHELEAAGFHTRSHTAP